MFLFMLELRKRSEWFSRQKLFLFASRIEQVRLINKRKQVWTFCRHETWIADYKSQSFRINLVAEDLPQWGIWDGTRNHLINQNTLSSMSYQLKEKLVVCSSLFSSKSRVVSILDHSRAFSSVGSLHVLLLVHRAWTGYESASFCIVHGIKNIESEVAQFCLVLSKSMMDNQLHSSRKILDWSNF